MHIFHGILQFVCLNKAVRNMCFGVILLQSFLFFLLLLLFRIFVSSACANLLRKKVDILDIAQQLAQWIMQQTSRKKERKETRS